MRKLPRPKKCKSCGEKFQPERQLQACCSTPCAIELAREKRARATRKQRRDEKKKFDEQDKAKQLKLAQAAFNLFIRLRDKDEPCISCGTTANVQYAAGHYRSVGAMPALRFHEDNVHKQCNRNCNSNKSGNAIEYRIGLVKKIGVERVEWLEQEHPAKKYTAADVIEIKKHYLARCRELGG